MNMWENPFLRVFRNVFHRIVEELIKYLRYFYKFVNVKMS